MRARSSLAREAFFVFRGSKGLCFHGDSSFRLLLLSSDFCFPLWGYFPLGCVTKQILKVPSFLLFLWFSLLLFHFIFLPTIMRLFCSPLTLVIRLVTFFSLIFFTVTNDQRVDKRGKIIFLMDSKLSEWMFLAMLQIN